MATKYVNVGIYGDSKGVKTVKYFTCDNTENCKHFQNGFCVCDIGFLSDWVCPHSLFGRARGYSERASKYHAWRNDWYAKRENIKTNKSKLCECGDYVYLPYAFLEDGWHKKPINCILGGQFIHKDNFTLENIIKIINWKPNALMGGEIVSYQKEKVPLFLQHLKEVFSEKFNELAQSYPEIISKYLKNNTQHIGRNAFVNSMPQGSQLIDCHRNVWIINGNEIVCEKWSTWLPFGKTPTEVRIKITDDMTVKIGSNNQVDESTQFVD